MWAFQKPSIESHPLVLAITLLYDIVGCKEVWGREYLFSISVLELGQEAAFENEHGIGQTTIPLWEIKDKQEKRNEYL